jgi:flavodoxin
MQKAKLLKRAVNSAEGDGMRGASSTGNAMLRTGRMSRRHALFASLLPILGAGLTWAPRSGQAQGGSESRTLVAYLSRSGNTRVIAGQLRRRYRADLFEIRTAVPYPEDYEETVERARLERDAAASPALAESVAGIARYKTVFLGFPIWGEALPAPVRTFLTTHDLSGVTVVPFITHGGYGPGSAPQTVADLAPRARLVEPFVLECDQERDTLTRVSGWLTKIEPRL